MLIKHLHTDKVGFNDFTSALNLCNHLSVRSDFNLFLTVTLTLSVRCQKPKCFLAQFSSYYGDGKLHKIHRLKVSW